MKKIILINLIFASGLIIASSKRFCFDPTQLGEINKNFNDLCYRYEAEYNERYKLFAKFTSSGYFASIIEEKCWGHVLIHKNFPEAQAKEIFNDLAKIYKSKIKE